MANVTAVSGNTSSNSAQKISIGDTLIGALTVKGGFQYYSIQVNGPSVLEINFFVNSTSLTNYAYTLNISNSQNQRISWATLGYGLTNSTFDTYLGASGTYFLYVGNNNIFLPDPYSFTLTYNNQLLGNIQQKPNNTLPTATKINLSNTITGHTSNTNDAGYYSFSISKTSNYAISFDAPITSLVTRDNTEIQSANYSLSILDSNGRTLQTYTTFFQNTSPTLFSNLNPGNYYFLINGATGYNGDNYHFAINNTQLSNSKKIIVGNKLSDTIQVDSKVKTYAINLVAGNFYQFNCYSDNTTLLSGLKGEKLSLLNLNGNVIENNLNTPSIDQEGATQSTINLEPSIEIIAPYTGVYYLSVDSSTNTGSFTLDAILNAKNDLMQDVLSKAMKSTPNAFWKNPSIQTLNLTYAFMTTNPSSAQVGFAAMTAEQQVIVQKALQTVSSLVSINFTLTTDEKSANLLYGTSTQSSSSGVTASIKNNSDGTYKQKGVFMNNTGPWLSTMMDSGGRGFQILLHETGHALGLKHPGEYNSGSTQDLSYLGPFAPSGWDNSEYTIMSYVPNQYLLNTYKSSYSTIDIAALQNLYGVPTDLKITTFTVSPTAPITTTAPIGALGSTVDLSNQTIGCNLSLLAGTLSSIGVDSRGVAAHDNITMPWGSQFNKVITSPVGDVIYCNNLNDTITLTAGNNTVISSGGNDLVNVNQNSTNISINSNNGFLTVTDTTGKFGTNTLININRIKLTDTNLAFDLAGNAGSVAKVIGAIFGPAAVKNPTYVGIGLNYLDNNMTYSQLSALALNAAGAKTPAQIVNLLYTNVVGLAPTTSQANPYIQMLATGTSPGDLAVLAEDTSFNIININLTGLSTTGIKYIPINL